MFNKTYYQGKQFKLQQKLAKIKDQFLVDVLNLGSRVTSEIQEIQNENQEISALIEENKKETKIPVKIKKGG